MGRDAVATELKRQGTDTVDFKFCLNWHRNEFQTDGQLVKGLRQAGYPVCSNDANSLAALIHLMVLEHLELIESHGDMTVLGNVLADTPKSFQEPCLVALELMKFGILSGEPFEAAQVDR